MTSELMKILDRYKFSLESFILAGLRWDQLLTIYDDHAKRAEKLNDVRDSLLRALRHAGDMVHSTRGRVKNPEGLVAKIIRKRIEDPQRVITVNNYSEEITDLIGLRVLHHFKRDWHAVHKFIADRWEFHETPKAYVREGDPSALLDEFRKAQLEIHIHPDHYRSVHYLIKQRDPVLGIVIVEVQVRTVFEEAWSEIDHMIRYPHGVESGVTSESLELFNRVAGSADDTASFINDHYRAWEKSALEGAATKTRLNVADLSILSRVLSIPRRELQRELAAMASPDEQKTRADDNKRRQGAEEKLSGIMNAVLTKYYGQRDSGLDQYVITVDKTIIDTSIFTSSERIGMSVDLHLLDIQWSDAQDKDIKHPNGQYAFRTLKYMLDRGVRIWNAPKYRLRKAPFQGPFQLVFSISHFLSARFLYGLLEDEIIDANISGESADKIAARLPIRDQLLPRNHLQEFEQRICCGGVGTLCAFRREKENDFVILLQQRSAQVTDARGQLSVVPKAYHEPGVGDLVGEVGIYWTILREFYEEIFGGSDAERVPDLDRAVDWFCDKTPGVRAIRDGEYGASLKCTAFGVYSKDGFYCLAALLSVRDPEYWDRYSHHMKPMWETASPEFMLVSSRDEAALHDILTRSDWAGDALFAFVEGLFELKNQFPDLVSLPNIVRSVNRE